ncbi:MAG: HisA/HisF-related TIM barrel protein [Fuerstiella sp.]
MQIIPVIDILDGQVVHGRAGNRESYQRIHSQLTDSVKPLEVLDAMVQAAAAKTAYVADLNGLMQHQVQVDVLHQLAEAGVDLMIDVGIRSADDVKMLPDAKHVQWVLASESIPSLQALQEMLACHPHRPFVFSFDLIDGLLRSPVAEWQAEPLIELAKVVWELGVSDWIVLDVKSVGMTTGPTTLARCSEFKSRFPESRLITGGGVRDLSDLKCLQQLGISDVLLATALHDRTIQPLDMAGLKSM